MSPFALLIQACEELIAESEASGHYDTCGVMMARDAVALATFQPLPKVECQSVGERGVW